MTIFQGNEGCVQVGANEVAEIRSWTLNRQVGTISRRNAKDDHERLLYGVGSASGTISCWYDDADVQGQTALNNAVIGRQFVTLKLYPGGNATGREEITIVALLESTNHENPEDLGVASRTYNFQAAEKPDVGTVA
jgi:hypothetical protein